MLYLINISKILRAYGKIDEFLSCQQNPYKCRPREDGEAHASLPPDPAAAPSGKRPVVVLKENPELRSAMDEWMAPDEAPSMTQLYRQARDVQLKENENLVRTLEYLGL